MVKRSKHASSCNLFSICYTYRSKRSPLHVLLTTKCRIVEGTYKHLWHILAIRLEKLKSDQEVKLHCGKNGAWCLFPRSPTGRRCRWVGLSNNTLQHTAQYTGLSNNTLQHKAQYTGLSNNTLQHTAQYTGLSNNTLEHTAQYTDFNAQFDTLVCPTFHLDTRLKGNQCGIICKLWLLQHILTHFQWNFRHLMYNSATGQQHIDCKITERYWY